jgi:hypothetical protein
VAMESMVRLLIKNLAVFLVCQTGWKQRNCMLYIASFGFPYYLYDPS